MKHLIPKLLLVIIAVIGISSFVVLKTDTRSPDKEEVGNTRFNAEMDDGFAEREVRF
ncbi:MAG: hypothetical protein MI975_20985 [Cytophagales bacterium]|nr:hypothetical protein [Cytophagales bacterium]